MIMHGPFCEVCVPKVRKKIVCLTIIVFNLKQEGDAFLIFINLILWNWKQTTMNLLVKHVSGESLDS